ncbi:MAG: DUF1540 domain-containing protein [Defluviitaleaceae bacterium]|nr:DUF1540 domain-containing protein [Defluviitaleaceae bacterium]
MQPINSSIKCNVDTCKHNSLKCCTLNDIMVGNTTMEASCKGDTECVSFEPR